MIKITIERQGVEPKVITDICSFALVGEIAHGVGDAAIVQDFVSDGHIRCKYKTWGQLLAYAEYVRACC